MRMDNDIKEEMKYRKRSGWIAYSKLKNLRNSGFVLS
jgi:hypothetical protein